MPYIKDDDGRLNNFAKEPKVYEAVPPNKNQLLQYPRGYSSAADFC